jgi:hypothetical protein
MKHFPNGFDSWMETHYEVVQAITLKLSNEDMEEDSALYERLEEEGTGGMYMLSEELTDAFEEEYEGAEWGEKLDYYDTIENFLNTKL